MLRASCLFFVLITLSQGSYELHLKWYLCTLSCFADPHGQAYFNVSPSHVVRARIRLTYDLFIFV